MFISLYHTVPVNARGSITESRNCVKSLGIYTDSNFAFGNHLNRICCKASQKLHALSRFVKYISDEKRMFRSSYQKCSIKKGVLRNFAKFTGKYLCQSLFFNKIAGLGPATLLKKRLWHRCFAVKFAKFLRTPFVTEHLRWLLLTAANFLSVPRICTIQNTSYSLAKAHLRTSFLRKSSQ